MNYLKVKTILEDLLKKDNNYDINTCINDINAVYLNKNNSNVFIFEQDIDYLLYLCCTEFNTTLDEIKGSSRIRNIVLARHISIHILIEYKAGTLKSIGKLFGDRDHTTIIHAYRQINNMISTQYQGYEKYVKIKNNFDEYVGNSKIKITEETELLKPKKAFPIQDLENLIDSKLVSIDNVNTSDKEIKRSIGVEKTTLLKVKENIDTLKSSID
jgi:hypothetical protein